MTHTEKIHKKGFTLIELMIAIAVFAIISLVVIPNVLKYMKDAKISSAKANLQVLKGAITQYQLSINQLPTRLTDLVKSPADEKAKKKWTGSFLEKTEVPEDPWGEKYQYKVNAAGASHPYELYSFGENGKGAPKAEWIDVWDL